MQLTLNALSFLGFTYGVFTLPLLRHSSSGHQNTEQIIKLINKSGLCLSLFSQIPLRFQRRRRQLHSFCGWVQFGRWRKHAPRKERYRVLPIGSCSILMASTTSCWSTTCKQNWKGESIIIGSLNKDFQHVFFFATSSSVFLHAAREILREEEWWIRIIRQDTTWTRDRSYLNHAQNVILATPSYPDPVWPKHFYHRNKKNGHVHVQKCASLPPRAGGTAQSPGYFTHCLVKAEHYQNAALSTKRDGCSLTRQFWVKAVFNFVGM